MTKSERRRIEPTESEPGSMEIFDDDPADLNELIAAAKEVSHAWHFEDEDCDSLSFDAKMIRLRKALEPKQ